MDSSQSTTLHTTRSKQLTSSAWNVTHSSNIRLINDDLFIIILFYLPSLIRYIIFNSEDKGIIPLNSFPKKLRLLLLQKFGDWKDRDDDLYDEVCNILLRDVEEHYYY